MQGLFGFCVRHGTTLKCMRLTEHKTLKFYKNMSTAAVFLDIEKVFDATWHLRYLHKLSKWKFSVSVIKFISSEKIQCLGRR
jgi:hypothetical protein